MGPPWLVGCVLVACVHIFVFGLWIMVRHSIRLPVPHAFDFYKLAWSGLGFQSALDFGLWDVLASNGAGMGNERLEVPNIVRLDFVGLFDRQCSFCPGAVRGLHGFVLALA